MSDWDPAQYLLFEAERTRPSVDLVARIDIKEPKAVVDIGCGPGNSARAIRERWPRASILGLDRSPAMIEAATSEYPAGKWIVADAADFKARETYDIVFSNAALQWIPDHASLVPRLMDAVLPGGAMAVQVPQFTAMPIHTAIELTACSARWKKRIESRKASFSYHDADYYYDLLCRLAKRIDLWETFYYHILQSHSALIEFMRSTGLKPYLDAIPGEESKAEFERDVQEECERAYPLRTDGKLLFPFNRLFFIAYK